MTDPHPPGGLRPPARVARWVAPPNGLLPYPEEPAPRKALRPDVDQVEGPSAAVAEELAR
ncbi:hypothetical protein ACN20G_28115 (plasmid) [Streptomyces sp. BI20]|uniref:hypothetical protein n=1 Tax=Streptomyces sp. BI20 TaxID=3403460 RepID=UPI003C711CE5